MVYFAIHDLGLDFDNALFGEPASRLMLMLNQHSLANLGEDKMMTLLDLEAIESNGRQ